MSLAIDGKATGTANINAATGSVTSGSLTQANAGDILVAVGFVNTRGFTNAPSASGVTDTTGLGLTWARRAQVLVGTASILRNTLEVWWAYAPSAFSSKTVTMSWTCASTIANGALSVFGVSGFTGTAYQTAPWDTNGPWTASATVGTAQQINVPGISTASTSGLLIGAGASDDGTGPGVANAPGTWSTISNVIANLGSGNAILHTDDQLFSVAQSGATATWTNTTTTDWAGYVDALVIPSGGSGGGVPYNPWPQLGPITSQHHKSFTGWRRSFERRRFERRSPRGLILPHRELVIPKKWAA